jgi:hypothetical protein
VRRIDEPQESIVIAVEEQTQTTSEIDRSAEIGPKMDFSAHWDQVLLIVHLGGTTPRI